MVVVSTIYILSIKLKYLTYRHDTGKQIMIYFGTIYDGSAFVSSQNKKVILFAAFFTLGL